ncbi:uncharacterized protein PSFLO_02272 [Pseudozyma flocculosa]|uniref:Uncharacterized protein n=1 Tax=Pseudozyma flocculosa TaxID=84751 RepID=A0A5C3F0K9_9BASI|nr:uncharacterized protein PSFLO_02272 [Pseudozyma flocculosa]
MFAPVPEQCTRGGRGEVQARVAVVASAARVAATIAAKKPRAMGRGGKGKVAQSPRQRGEVARSKQEQKQRWTKSVVSGKPQHHGLESY